MNPARRSVRPQARPSVRPPPRRRVMEGQIIFGSLSHTAPAWWRPTVYPGGAAATRRTRTHSGIRRRVTRRRCRSASSRGGRRSPRRADGGSAGGDADGGVAPDPPNPCVRAGGDRRGHAVNCAPAPGGHARPRPDRSPATRPSRPRRRFSILDAGGRRRGNSSPMPGTIVPSTAMIRLPSPMSTRPTARPSGPSPISRDLPAFSRSTAMAATGC